MDHHVGEPEAVVRLCTNGLVDSYMVVWPSDGLSGRTYEESRRVGMAMAKKLGLRFVDEVKPGDGMCPVCRSLWSLYRDGKLPIHAAKAGPACEGSGKWPMPQCQRCGQHEMNHERHGSPGCPGVDSDEHTDRMTKLRAEVAKVWPPSEKQ